MGAKMEIRFRTEIIGQMTNPYREDYWIHGRFAPADGYYKYFDFFEALVCEDGMDESRFDQELFNENNWFVADENGLHGIWFPAIYTDGDISIRYR